MRGVWGILLLACLGCSGSAAQQAELKQLDEQIAVSQQRFEQEKKDLWSLPEITEQMQKLARENQALKQERDRLRKRK